MVEVCLPPDCPLPVAASWPALFGDSLADKAAMAAALLCVGLAAWGLALLIGRISHWRAPAGSASDPRSKEFWSFAQDARIQSWKKSMARPELRAQACKQGLGMIGASLLLALGLMRIAYDGKMDFVGSIARVQRWDGERFVSESALRLDAGGSVCLVPLETPKPTTERLSAPSRPPCQAWGKWSTSGPSLALSLGANGQPAEQFTPDDSLVRFWSHPGSDKVLSRGIFVDFPPQPKFDATPLDPGPESFAPAIFAMADAYPGDAPASAPRTD